MKQLALFLLLMCSVICFAQSNEIKPPLGTQIENWPQGLVGWWLFNEGVGTRVNDLSGNGNHGTITGATWTGGKFGPCLSFDGNADYVTIGRLSCMEGSSAFSLAFWCRPTTTGQYDTIFVKSTATNHRITWQPQSSNGSISIFVEGGSSASYGSTAAGVLVAGTWQHYVVVFDGTGADNAARLQLYRNGTQVAFASFTGAIPAVTTTDTSPFAWGRNHTTACLDGLLDLPAIFNRALTPAEIAQLYREPFSGFSLQRPDMYVAAAPPASGSQVIIIARSMSPVAIPLSVICSMAWMMRRERKAA